MTSSVNNQKSNYYFRNQPSFTIFNKTFVDGTDSLYLGLNEINPIFLENEHQDEIFDPVRLLDPRNGNIVNENLIDHTKPHENQTGCKLNETPFCNENKEPETLGTFGNIIMRRNEKQALLNWISECNLTQTERIYTYAKQMVALYKIWYRRRAQMITSRIEGFCYNTYSGLPTLSKCGSSEHTTEIICAQTQDHNMPKTESLPIEDMYDFMDLKNKLETYAAIGIDEMEKQEKLANAALKDIIESACYKNSYKYCINLDSLLFLFIPGEYPDLSTEMFLDIEENAIKFHDPLPARNCGWHTNTKVVELAFIGFQTTLRNNFRNYKSLDSSLQLNSIQSFSDALIENRKDGIESDYIIIDWQLENSDNNEKLQIFTVIQQPPKMKSLPNLRSFILKLDHKSQFGCEVMTKYELLKEWFTLRLLSTHEDQVSCRFRLSTNTLQLLLTESVVLSKIEQQLMELYHIKLPGLLNGLFDFLGILRSIPAGRYLLRFNDYYRDKFLLCKESLEKTQHSIVLSEILLKQPCDFVFMTKQNFLPIAENLSNTKFRLNHCFPHCIVAGKGSDQLQKPFNDRHFLLLNCETKAKLREKIIKAQKRFRKSRKKKSRNIYKEATQKRRKEKY